MLLNTPKKGSLEAFGGDESNHGKASDSPFESIFFDASSYGGFSSSW